MRSFFINSIANQVLMDEDEQTVMEHYGHLLPRLVGRSAGGRAQQ